MLLRKGVLKSCATFTLLSLVLFSCETPGQISTELPTEFMNNPDAREVWEELTNGGTTLPSAEELTAALRNPGDGIQADCSLSESESESESLSVTMSSRDSDAFDERTGEYNITRQSQRVELINEIIAAGPDRLGTTTMRMPNGETYEVMNDNVTLPDGTYVPLTFPEAQAIARAWGYQLPNSEQAVAIGRFAASNGNQYAAITREPNNGSASQLRSVNALMNDSRMRSRAQAGQEDLIDGHFKWYTDTGRIYGFARGNGRFYQNTPSGAHVRDPSYYDYSHGVRLIRRVQ